jgi:hypothetical protein
MKKRSLSNVDVDTQNHLAAMELEKCGKRLKQTHDSFYHLNRTLSDFNNSSIASVTPNRTTEPCYQQHRRYSGLVSPYDILSSTVPSSASFSFFSPPSYAQPMDFRSASQGLSETDPLEPITSGKSFISLSDSYETEDSTHCPDSCSSSTSLFDSIEFNDDNIERPLKDPRIPTQSPTSLPSIASDVSIGSFSDEQQHEDTKSSFPLSTTFHDKSKDKERFKPFHEEKWNYHLNELLEFKRKHGHCLVPHSYPQMPHLARWVKRQRRQYKLKMEGNAESTMTRDRIETLNRAHFVWDSHEAVWNERLAQIQAYRKLFGHCRIPSYCSKYPQLASWVKCQRRQYKLFWEGKASAMNLDRIQLLDDIDFTWEVRTEKKKKNKKRQDFEHLADILKD